MLLSVTGRVGVRVMPRRSLSAAPLFPLRVYGILVLALESCSDLSLASSGPLAGAAFIFVWRLKHSNTYDQARARTSRACSEVRPASGLNVVSALDATVDVPLHVLVEGETVDSYRLANPGRPDLSGVH